MARIDLKHCDVILKDGLAGTAAVNQSMTAPMSGDTTLTIDTVVLNTDLTQKVPIGAKFKIAGETDTSKVHTVTGRTNSMDVTTAITFTPALGAGTYADGGVLTFQAQELVIKVGNGDITYSEKNEMNYELDRGKLDTVREGDEQPMEVSLNFTYEHITTGTNETVAPMDAIKRRGSAAEWVSSATDKCEPFSVDIVVLHSPKCGTAQKERTTFPDFRSEQRDVSFREANVQVNGKCNVTEPIVARE